MRSLRERHSRGVILGFVFLGAFLGGGRGVVASPPSFPSFKEVLISQAKAHLPKQLEETLESTGVLFKDLGGLPKGCSDDLSFEEGRVFGRFKNNTIELNSHLYDWFVKNEKIECLHGTTKKVAMATLIHELVHAWEEKSFKRTIPSRSREYIDLIHAKKTVLGKIKILNQKASRSADPYELKNNREHFAVNVEYFLLDDTYKCRRPNLYQYFEKLFHFTPPSNCEVNYQVRLHQKTEESGFKTYSLRPKHVRGIHYVRSGRGEKAMSRFGHAGFRLLTCSLDLTDEQCLRATDQHLYLNFVARVEEGVINNALGLTGKYPIQLEILNFKEAVKSYTEVQEREVYSFPLDLTTDEKERFIHQVLTLYWEYAGRYFFTAKNCATEAYRLLKATLGQRFPEMRRTFKVTPNSVDRKLKDLGVLSEKQVIEKERSHFFSSSAEILERLFERVQKHFSPQVNRQDFFKWSLTERIELYDKVSSKRDKLVFAALEKHILKRKLSHIENSLAAKLHQLPSAHPLSQKAQRLYQLENLLKYGASVSSGYGILIEGDGLIEAQERKENYAQELSSIEQDIKSWALDVLKDSWAEVNEGLETLKGLLNS